MPKIGVLELRNYLLRKGEAANFLRYFEERFLFSQREVGMHVLGQFAVVGEPDRFAWIRGFESMAAREQGLTAFYGGPVWKEHGPGANRMLVDHENVHLLKPLGEVGSLTEGLALEDRAAEPAGVVPAGSGFLVADFYRARPGARGRLVALFENRLRPALIAQGHAILGHFVAELTPNGYPRLKVHQDPNLLVVLSAYRDGEEQRARRRAWSASAAWRGRLEGEMGALLAAPVEELHLRPSARSLMRYWGAEALSGLAPRGA
jgi:hypothetical protein